MFFIDVNEIVIVPLEMAYLIASAITTLNSALCVTNVVNLLPEKCYR